MMAASPSSGRRLALVTGASRGIGRAVALALAAGGHDLALAARSRDALEDVAAEAEALGARVEIVAADLQDPAAVEALRTLVLGALGPPLVVVNNAGAAASHKFEGHPDALWDQMLAVNLTSAYRVTRAFAPGMLAAGWGRVINVGSVASLSGNRYIAAYTAAKHGLLGLTRALAVEWARRGVTVNLVAPGYVDTDMTAGTVANIAARTGRGEGEARAVVEAMSPQRRLVRPEEVAALVAFLASDAAAAITGAALPVDGAATAGPATG